MKTVIKKSIILSLLITAFITTACSNAIPTSRRIFNPNAANIPSSPKNAVTVAGGINNNATYKVSYSVNMVNAAPALNGTTTVRAADPEVLHHVHP